MIEKVRDIKIIITMVMDRIQSNALVLYNMQHLCERNFIPVQKMAKTLREMQLYSNYSNDTTTDGGTSSPGVPLNFDIEARQLVKDLHKLRDSVASNSKNIFNFHKDKAQIMKEAVKQSEDSKKFAEKMITVFKTEIIEKVAAKEYESDNAIKELKCSHHEMVTHQNEKTEEMVESIKWRIEDCETRLKTRITADYVHDLGK
jgi:hypothetical protein